MSRTHAIHVVGGGLIGLLTAYELVLSGATVVLVERHRAGSQASWAGGGILSPLYPWRYPDAVNRLARWGQQHYPALIARLKDESNIDAEWQQSGMLVFGAQDRERALQWSHDTGGHWQRMDAARELEPEIAPALGEALFDPSLAQVRNPRLIKALYAALHARGVVFREGVQVQAIMARGGRLQGLRVDGEELRAERCLLTAGAWTSQLLAPTGLTLPIRPVRGQMLLFKTDPGFVRHMVMQEGRYLIPRRDGRVLMGSTLEEAGFDATTTADARAALRSSALSLVPALERYPIEAHWAGLRPGSPEGIPFIGAHPGIDGLYVCAGHYRNGIVLGPASARLAADLLLERPPIVDPGPYGLESYARIG